MRWAFILEFPFLLPATTAPANVHEVSAEHLAPNCTVDETHFFHSLQLLEQARG